MPYNKSKLTRFQPFASACENGLVFIDKSSFPNEDTYNEYCNELEKFDGGMSGSHVIKDDWCDATASGFNYINIMKHTPSFTMPEMNTSTTRYRSVMNQTTPDFGSGLMNRGGHIA